MAGKEWGVGCEGLILVWDGASQQERQQSTPPVSAVIWGVCGGKMLKSLGRAPIAAPRMQVPPEGTHLPGHRCCQTGGAGLPDRDGGDKKWL